MEEMARYHRRTERMQRMQMNELDAAWDKEIAKGTQERRAWGQVPVSAYDTDAGGYDSELSEGSGEEELPDADHYEQLRQEAACDEDMEETIHPYEEECDESDGDDVVMVECGAGAASARVPKRTATEQAMSAKKKEAKKKEAKKKPVVSGDKRQQTSIHSFFQRK